jgi:hypothetical protein
MELRVARLMLELLEWVALRPRTYDEAMEVWRSSCPRHPVWDDAQIEGLIQITLDAETRGRRVCLTPRGRAMLAAGPRGLQDMVRRV